MVAATTRTETMRWPVPPTGRMVRLSSARNSTGCMSEAISPISSRNRVPPSASTNAPLRSEMAPVKAPRT